ncbi:hypothetical protein AGMMS49975_15310 [Clostridia bacterium]|nr:hypothetical protein AGMMS49975_15310 [Clostridia bacterium]
MRKWLEMPLIDIEKINERLDNVEEFVNSPVLREELQCILAKIRDLERILARLTFGGANARDLLTLKSSLLPLPDLRYYMEHIESGLGKSLYKKIDTLEDIFKLLESAIREDAPLTLKDGGMIKSGYDSELDKYLFAKDNGNDWLSKLENGEREKTGIKNLKIKYNKIFGYCFEVTNGQKAAVPDYFIRRQTLAACERYSTAELSEIEETLLSADEKVREREYALFCELRRQILEATERVKSTADIIAQTDCLVALAEAAAQNNYTRPIVENGDIIEIRDGRHPVVEKLPSASFVPNDTYLDANDTLAIITGPNMAGKSTYMRQTAVIAVMAQAGSFVPASYARISVIDRIFTRIGASDDLATGQSTFMVEMNEVANILNNAAKNSLLILDEIGRGTSTYDGLSIAWAILEYIVQNIHAKTLFATHYHELSELEDNLKGVKNYHITVRQNGDDISFLRKIEKGRSPYSYGIQVAKLSGIPRGVISRAEGILNRLNGADIVKTREEPSQGV